MEERQYKTAFLLAKVGEILGWASVVIGFISGFGTIARLGIGAAIAIVAFTAVAGIALVFASQLTLIFIDTENNTRHAMSEIRKTNLMLAETLGGMASNIGIIAGKESKS
jgi:hypothetical protein